jgi:hypothetical protein
MKKTTKRLSMARETLKLLSSETLTQANGGSFNFNPGLIQPIQVQVIVNPQIVPRVQSYSCTNCTTVVGC